MSRCFAILINSERCGRCNNSAPGLFCTKHKYWCLARFLPLCVTVIGFSVAIYNTSKATKTIDTFVGKGTYGVVSLKPILRGSCLGCYQMGYSNLTDITQFDVSFKIRTDRFSDPQVFNLGPAYPNTIQNIFTPIPKDQIQRYYDIVIMTRNDIFWQALMIDNGNWVTRLHSRSPKTSKWEEIPIDNYYAGSLLQDSLDLAIKKFQGFYNHKKRSHAR